MQNIETEIPIITDLVCRIINDTTKMDMVPIPITLERIDCLKTTLIQKGRNKNNAMDN